MAKKKEKPEEKSLSAEEIRVLKMGTTLEVRHKNSHVGTLYLLMGISQDGNTIFCKDKLFAKQAHSFRIDGTSDYIITKP